MKKQMKRTVYEAPVTERFQVELEGTMMSASAEVENTQSPTTGLIEEHVVNDSFNPTFENTYIDGTSNWE